MFLALDVGNSAVKGGLFEGAEPARVFSVSVDADRPDAWGTALAPHLRDAAIDAVGMASVVPATADAVTAALEARGDVPVTRVGPAMALPFGLAYETPDTLGADRLAAAAAGWVQYGAPPSRSVVVVDAGTAVTCEVVHRDGVYRGGTIAAGPTLTQHALRAGTAQLPEGPLALPDDPVGRSTQTALQSGIMWGLIDGVRGMTDRLAAALPDVPVLVLTGGWGGLLADHLDAADHHRPHLVLDGVRLLVTAGAD
ncbi:MAG: type III pantothenate kinase [Salinibacter sp.]